MLPMAPPPIPSTTSTPACAPSATCPASPPRSSSFLAARLGKPVLVEGRGRRQDRARQGARQVPRPHARTLQCYEGLDEGKALYEWNYRKQLLRIQAEAAGTGWEDVQDDIFGEEFLLARPLMNAIASRSRSCC